MSEDTAIVTQESREEWLPMMTVEQAATRYDEMQRFVKSILKEGVDFGIIPGTGDKPTLLKPGAEKFAKFFGLGIEHELIDSTEDWENGFFNYRYQITARSLRSGLIIATGEGSCNSKEKKYRIRYVPEFAATEDEKKRAISRETRVSKKGNEYVMLTVHNDDPYSIVNTIQKMAYKRALVAAVLVAANASDYFTQDIEDMAPTDITEVVEGEVRDVTPKQNVARIENQWEQNIIEKLLDLQLIQAKPHAVNILNRSPFMSVPYHQLEMVEAVAYVYGWQQLKENMPDMSTDERNESMNKAWAEGNNEDCLAKAIEMLGG